MHFHTYHESYSFHKGTMNADINCIDSHTEQNTVFVDNEMSSKTANEA